MGAVSFIIFDRMVEGIGYVVYVNNKKKGIPLLHHQRAKEDLMSRRTRVRAAEG